MLAKEWQRQQKMFTQTTTEEAKQEKANQIQEGLLSEIVGTCTCKILKDPGNRMPFKLVQYVMGFLHFHMEFSSRG